MIKPLHEREINASSREIVNKINQQSEYLNTIREFLASTMPWSIQAFERIDSKYNV